MLLQTIQKNRFGAIAIIMLITLALWLINFLGKAPWFPFLFDSFPMPLYKPIASYFANYPIWSKALAFILFMASGIYLLALNSRYILLKSRSYLPILLFALSSAAFLPIQRLNPALFSLIFILYSNNHLFAIYQKRDPLDNLFRAGFGLGIATLVYAPSVVVAIWALLTLLSLRSFNIREWFVLIFSYTVPFLLFMLILFIINQDTFHPYHSLLTCLLTDSESSVDDKVLWIFCLFLTLPFIVSLVSVFPKLAYQKIIIRRYYTAYLYLFLLVIIAFFTIPGVSYEIFYITATPIAFIMSEYFGQAKQNIWNQILFWLPVIGAVVVQVLFLI